MADSEIARFILAIFEGKAMVSTPRAFKVLDIAKSKGHDLINDGRLERVKIGRASRITVASIIRVAEEGTPPKPKKANPEVRLPITQPGEAQPRVSFVRNKKAEAVRP